MKTKQQFINQFPYKVNLSDCNIEPVFDSMFEGVEIYRMLNLLVIKIDNEYYGHA